MFKTNKDNIDNQQSCHDFGDRHQTTEKNNGVLNFFRFRKSRKVESKKQKIRSKSTSQKNLLYDNFSNDIVISSAGQTKIDNLDSCLNLVSSDFIVF